MECPRLLLLPPRLLFDGRVDGRTTRWGASGGIPVIFKISLSSFNPKIIK